MPDYQHMVLRREHQGCSNPIPVPFPTQTALSGGLPTNTKDTESAIFLRTDCGLASLYSISDLHQEESDTDCPYKRGLYRLAYIFAECDGQSCLSPTKVYITLDVSSGNVIGETPSEAWHVDSELKCPSGHAVTFHLKPGFQGYVCQMPF